MRAPLPTLCSRLCTAAVCAAVARSGAADARESKYADGDDGTAGGRAVVARLALAVAPPAVPAIAAAARLTPADSTNSRLRMLPPRVGKDRPAAERES